MRAQSTSGSCPAVPSSRPTSVDTRSIRTSCCTLPEPMTTARLRAVLRQRCPVCLQGRMFRGVFAMNAACPVCGHRFERETGFFQGAMYVSYALGIAEAFVLALVAMFVLAPRLGLVGAIAVAVVVHVACVPLLFRYSRVIWAHVNIGTLDAADPARLAAVRARDGRPSR
ncbi:MAG: hypothetical protein DMD28_05475 [Gemmatimonadetes bacterium]|nr:MAG: hypothetical protein DMD28_05475 [Gemmatimonadota bacterium]